MTTFNEPEIFYMRDVYVMHFSVIIDQSYGSALTLMPYP